MIKHKFGHILDMSYNYDMKQGVVTFQGIFRVDKKMFGASGLEIPDSLAEVLKSIE